MLRKDTQKMQIFLGLIRAVILKVEGSNIFFLFLNKLIILFMRDVLN